MGKCENTAVLIIHHCIVLEDKVQLTLDLDKSNIYFVIFTVTIKIIAIKFITMM